MENQPFVRLGFFVGIFVLMAVWERLAPRRELRTSRPSRWVNNLSVTFLDTALLHLLFPLMAVEVAIISSRHGWGLLHMISLPGPVAGIISVVLLDLIVYGQHVVFHHVRPLWKVHMMHHTDLDLDVTSGSRFHPIEIVLSMGLRMAVVLIMGAPAWSVVVFEVLLNMTSMFNHSNVFLPPGLDRVLRLFVVTPDMHRVHHSVIIRETDSNFGFSLPWWDRLFGTYSPQPIKGQEEMNLGLANFRDPARLTLAWMLAMPFLGKDR